MTGEQSATVRARRRHGRARRARSAACAVAAIALLTAGCSGSAGGGGQHQPNEPAGRHLYGRAHPLATVDHSAHLPQTRPATVDHSAHLSQTRPTTATRAPLGDDGHPLLNAVAPVAVDRMGAPPIARPTITRTATQTPRELSARRCPARSMASAHEPGWWTVRECPLSRAMATGRRGPRRWESRQPRGDDARRGSTAGASSTGHRGRRASAAGQPMARR